MNTPEDESPLCKAFKDGSVYTSLEEYIASCAFVSDSDTETEKKSSRKKDSSYRRFPNFAGFCRYLGIGTDELLELSSRFPREFGRIRATLEDEALNASLSPTVIAAYFKKRLGYEKDSDRDNTATTEIRFEHDIWEDGA